jgi:hypothetical protein
MEPTFTSPCLVCRRRLRWNGQPVFTTCSCLNYGRSVTIVALAAGMSVVALGLLWRLQKQ